KTSSSRVCRWNGGASPLGASNRPTVSCPSVAAASSRTEKVLPFSHSSFCCCSGWARYGILMSVLPQARKAMFLGEVFGTKCPRPRITTAGESDQAHVAGDAVGGDGSGLEPVGHRAGGGVVCSAHDVGMSAPTMGTIF